MEFKEFLEMIKNEVQENVGDDISVTIQQTCKVNTGEKWGLSFRKAKENAGIIIYVDDLFEKEFKEEDFDNCVKAVVHEYNVKHFSVIPDLTFVTKWDIVKEQIRILMMEYRMNTNLLQNIPHRQYLNLAISYVIPLENHKIRITNELLLKWGITEQELYDKALENINKYEEPRIMWMSDIVADSTENIEMNQDDRKIIQEMSEVKEQAMYVLTNDSRQFGASGILSTYIIKELADLVNSNFYLLPSSIHEWIISIDNGSITADILQEMVKEINDAVVEPEEVLSGSIYYYDRDKNEVKVVLY